MKFRIFAISTSFYIFNTISPSMLRRALTLDNKNNFSAQRSLEPQFMRPFAAMSAIQPITTPLQCDPKHIPGFLRWIELCNNGSSALAKGDFIPFNLAEKTVGYLSHSFVDHLRRYSDTFQISASAVHLAPSLQSADLETRSTAVGAAMAALRDAGVISGWRNELYPVLTTFYEPPALLLERAAAPMFGIKAYGIHVNGYVRGPDGSIKLWVARRSAAKPTWPGMLDHIVAGGQPYGLSLAENVVKECQEEAGIPAALAATAVPVGVVSYTSLQSVGLKRDVLFCYDVELPADFQPVPEDGEVQEFFLLPLARVAELVAGAGDDLKDNCNLVVLDFLIRHGYLTPDTPGYLDVVRGLRSGDCS